MPEAAAQPAKKTKKPAKAKAAKKPAAKKTSAKKAAKKSAPKEEPKAPQAAETSGPSDAEIRLRAYFIAERRLQDQSHGDPANDWIEAREQLIAEASQARA